MKIFKNCKHCDQLFKARRKNHMYCRSSCKTLASYQRNNYTYVSGHYQTNKKDIDHEEKLMIPANVDNQIKDLEGKVDEIACLQKNKSINVTEISNAAIGSAAADTAIHGLKKIFAPNLLPMTKGDFEVLRNEIENIKRLLKCNKEPFV